MTSEEFGQDLEHVEVLQKKFDEFHKDLVNHEDRVNEVNTLAEKLIQDQHPEEETVRKRQAVSNLVCWMSRLQRCQFGFICFIVLEYFCTNESIFHHFV